MPRRAREVAWLNEESVGSATRTGEGTGLGVVLERKTGVDIRKSPGVAAVQHADATHWSRSSSINMESIKIRGQTGSGRSLAAGGSRPLPSAREQTSAREPRRTSPAPPGGPSATEVICSRRIGPRRSRLGRGPLPRSRPSSSRIARPWGLPFPAHRATRSTSPSPTEENLTPPSAPEFVCSP